MGLSTSNKVPNAVNAQDAVPLAQADGRYSALPQALTTLAQTITGVKTFLSMPIVPAQSMVRLNTANGYGSTNTVIRRFTTVVTNQGADITYADSATLGASFTINTSGVYAITLNENLNAVGVLGLSVDSNQLTTAILSITAVNRLVAQYNGTANAVVSTSWTGYLTAGQVVRPHNDGTAVGSNTAAVQLTIVRIL